MTTSGSKEDDNGRGHRFLPTDRFGEIGDNFIAQADATYSLLRLTYELSDHEFDFSPASEGLSGKQRSEVREGVRAIANAILDVVDKDQPGPRSRRFELGSDPAVTRAVARMVFNAAHRVKMPSKKQLVRRSMLLLAVSDFELLIGEVAGLAMEFVPGVAQMGDASITLAELESLEDVRAAKKVVIDRRVEDLLRQNMEGWISWFDNIGVKWKDMAEDWCRFAEIFARRNVVIHAGGKATAQYIGALRAAGCRTSDLPAIGTKLDLDDSYLTAASEELLAFGVLLVAGSWLQAVKGNTHSAESWITSRCQHLLELQHLHAVKAICRTVLEHSRGRLRQRTELLLRTMAWVARKDLGDGDKVRAEVEEWETSGTDLLYAHAKAVLLDNDELAVKQITELRRRNDLTVVELVASPLYRGLLDRCRSELLPEDGETISVEIESQDDDDTTDSRE